MLTRFSIDIKVLKDLKEEERTPALVGRGPVPRRAAVYLTIARDRPSRYGEKNVFRFLQVL